jgi:hypothetical protein
MITAGDGHRISPARGIGPQLRGRDRGRARHRRDRLNRQPTDDPEGIAAWLRQQLFWPAGASSTRH